MEKQKIKNKYIDTIFQPYHKGVDFINKKINKNSDDDPPVNFSYKEIQNKRKKKIRFGKIALAVLVFIFCIIPLKIIDNAYALKAQAQESINQFESAYLAFQSNDLEKAKTELESIQKNLGEIETKFEETGQKNFFITKFGPSKNAIVNYENILSGVSSLLKITNSMIDDWKYISEIQISIINTNKNNQEFFSKIKSINQKLKEFQNEFDSFNENIQGVGLEELKGGEKKYFTLLKENTDRLKDYYQLAINLTDEIPSFLGEGFDKKYLLLFQNNTELRPTGGFIGTYGILTMRDAKIKSIFIDSIYNPDGQISKKIEPPEPLKKITDHLAMRDANWYPDFPTSAKMISDLYEIEDGFTPDGIIAIDTKLFVDLLKITGPIKLEKYDVEINPDNFIELTQQQTTGNYKGEDGNPKKFLADFAPLFLENIFKQEKENQKQIWNILLENLNEKHIQFYSARDAIEKIFIDLNIAGEMRDSGQEDYFAYINANIGGLKTNHLITEKLTHQISLNKGGQLVHEVTLEREHKGENKGFSGTNYAYLRFYLPKGSQVTDVQGFEKKDSIKKNPDTQILYLEEDPLLYTGKATIQGLDVYEENGKTVVGAWQVLKPGESLESSITYVLPITNKTNSNYKLLIQKQAGVISQETEVTIKNGNRTIDSVKFNLFSDKEVSLTLPR